MKKMMKRTAAMALTLLIVLSLAACSSSSADGGPGGETLRIALMVQGPAADNGWNQSALNGVNAVKEQYGAELTVSENLDLSDFEEYFSNFGKEGYDIVFGHGSSFEDAAMKVAPDYPDTFFVVTSGTCAQEPNLCSVDNDGIQQGFLSGAFAGLFSESRVIGIVGGMEIPSIIAWAEGAKRGAEYVADDLTILINYTGNFEDSVAAKEVATAMIEQGADVVMQNLDPAGVGVLEACEEYNVPYIGSIMDQYSLAPEVVVTSGMADMTQSILDVTDKILNGEAECTCYIQSVENGAVYLAPFQGKWVNEVPGDVQTRIQEIYEDILSGELDVSE